MASADGPNSQPDSPEQSPESVQRFKDRLKELTRPDNALVTDEYMQTIYMTDDEFISVDTTDEQKIPDEIIELGVSPDFGVTFTKDLPEGARVEDEYTLDPYGKRVIHLKRVRDLDSEGRVLHQDEPHVAEFKRVFREEGQEAGLRNLNEWRTRSKESPSLGDVSQEELDGVLEKLEQIGEEHLVSNPQAYL